MNKRKFFIDTDTASDDAVALLMALETPNVEVLGVSIVSGNMPVEQGSINARYTIELCKKDVPVFVGADKPLLKKREHADWFHGPDGMGNMNYPKPKLEETNEDFIDILNDYINKFPDEITLDTLGNVTPAAEYNIWCDPEAAELVFKSQHKNIDMVGWELCRGEANLTEQDMELAYSFKTDKADFTIDCNKHALESSQNWLGDPGLGLPDPVAMAVALNPNVITKASRHNVQIVLDGPARGMTIVDQLHVGENEPHIDEYWSNTEKNINVIWEIDSAEWKETLYKTIRD